MNWGKWIVVSFLLFAALMGAIVTISMRQDVNLVSNQYYHDDLIYQEQLQRKNNAETLTQKPEFSITNNQLHIAFRGEHQIENGKVTVFRPSNAKLDQDFTLRSSSDPEQIFALKPLEKGAYRIKMTWVSAGKEFYVEKFVVI
jgi:hypothetical protein